MKGLEIERKFLVHEIPFDLADFQAAELQQGYLGASDWGNEVRLRREGRRFFLTVKFGRGLEREVLEIELSEEQFTTLWPATAGRQLKKLRHKIPYRGHTIELDVYQDQLAGLVVAEIEFTDTAASSSFLGPDWLGQEVTDDEAYKNRSLAVRGIP